jgi:hypothetical protein
MSLPFLNTAPGYDEELRNSVFFERGLHATSICGAVGAAVAVAMLQGQDEAGIASAAGIAASMGAGLLEANRTGGTVKRVHCGWAAHCGVAAADLARHGLTGPPTVLEGRFGFLQAFCGDRAHPDAVVRGLGTDWELPRVVFKPYACNHFTHAGVDAALRLRAQGLARGPRRGQPRRPRQPPVRRGAGEEVPRQRREVPSQERAAELAARTLAFPDAQSVEDLTALLTSAGER